MESMTTISGFVSARTVWIFSRLISRAMQATRVERESGGAQRHLVRPILAADVDRQMFVLMAASACSSKRRLAYARIPPIRTTWPATIRRPARVEPPPGGRRCASRALTSASFCSFDAAGNALVAVPRAGIGYGLARVFQAANPGTGPAFRRGTRPPHSVQV